MIHVGTVKTDGPASPFGLTGLSLRRLTERRVRAAAVVARDRWVPIAIESLRELLPVPISPSDVEVAAWVKDEVGGYVRNGILYPDGAAPSDGLFADRKRRGVEYLRRATEFGQRTLRPIHTWIRTLGVTGSTAYGEPEEGDDIDFMLITRSGAVWASLLFIFLRLRLSARSFRRERRSIWCINYVLDDTSARSEFDEPHGFLFARDALSTRVVFGAEHYRSLLDSATWLQNEAPRMYANWMTNTVRSEPDRRPAPPMVRLLDRLIFPFLASYQQGRALVHNHRLRREGRAGEYFRVITSQRRFVVLSEKYSQLLTIYAGASAYSPESFSTGRDPGTVGSGL
jgi:hypothetical protein